MKCFPTDAAEFVGDVCMFVYVCVCVCVYVTDIHVSHIHNLVHVRNKERFIDLFVNEYKLNVWADILDLLMQRSRHMVCASLLQDIASVLDRNSLHHI